MAVLLEGCGGISALSIYDWGIEKTVQICRCSVERLYGTMKNNLFIENGGYMDQGLNFIDIPRISKGLFEENIIELNSFGEYKPQI